MPGRVIEISGEPRHISLRRGSIVVSDGESELGLVDLDGVLSIIVTSRGASVTTPMLVEASSRNIPIIICNERYQPISVALPVVQHSDQTRRFTAQATAKKGLKNKTWQRIVMCKVRNQSSLLCLIQSGSAERLKRLSSNIKAGDPDNIEAQAAQVYWPALFTTKIERKKATKFRNQLLDLGFEMVQFSVYMKYCAGKEQVEVIESKIRPAVPEYGNVKLLHITDKQFGSILHLGRHSKRSINTDQLVLF